MTLQEQLNIIQNQFGLQIKEIETNVYKVLNTNQEVNIDKLQWSLQECVLIASTKRGREISVNGVSAILSSVYYIITNYDIDLACKYERISLKEHKDTILAEYQYDADTANIMDTFYELGVE